MKIKINHISAGGYQTYFYNVNPFENPHVYHAGKKLYKGESNSKTKLIDGSIKMNVIKVTTGQHSTLILARQGNTNKTVVYGISESPCFILGKSETEISKVPLQKIPLHDNLIVTDIGVTDNSSFFVTKWGKTLGVGNNESGEIGVGGKQRVESIREIEFRKSKDEIIKRKMEQVSCGWNHAIHIDDKGNCFSAGENSDGQLGRRGTLKKPADFCIIIEYFASKRIVVTQTSCGSYSTMFLSIDGEVFGCGWNTYDQLGVGKCDKVIDIVKIKFPHVVKSVVCGSYHSLFLAKDSLAFVCGRSEYGQTGISKSEDLKGWSPVKFTCKHETFDRFQFVTVGEWTTFFVSDDNRVFSVGYNSDHQLGRTTNSDVPMEMEEFVWSGVVRNEKMKLCKERLEFMMEYYEGTKRVLKFALDLIQ